MSGGSIRVGSDHPMTFSDPLTRVSRSQHFFDIVCLRNDR